MRNHVLSQIVFLFFSATDCSGSDFEAGAGTGLSKSSLNSSSSAEKKISYYQFFRILITKSVQISSDVICTSVVRMFGLVELE